MSQELAKQADDKTLFGFWVYILTDCVVFACLFATFAVLRFNTFGGPGAEELFSLPFVFVETMLLLTSSFVCGLAILAARAKNKKQTLILLAVTFVLGLAFVGMEISEFSNLVHEGNSWQRSAFLSSFFTLVGTHGLHITVGLVWILTMGWLIYRRGLERNIIRKLLLFSLFWHFLDIVWIFIFTIVYLLGATL
ncbi:cytochrome o ubiquinol oxidase subunit III [Candidatus Saccharibacteria bacterium]|nr:cytochrome o ubiquinol oxidase subunit III [Candidatus Saccharibacteria bacterium]